MRTIRPTILLVLLATAAGANQARALSHLSGTPYDGEEFGDALGTGDFDGDGYDDLVVGVPDDIVGGDTAGSIDVVYGSSGGLTTSGNTLWNQDMLSGAASETRDRMGSAIATGDFDGDGYDDIAVGAWAEAVGSVDAAGAVNVFYGSASGITTSGEQNWSQDSSGVHGVAEEDDTFGWSLAAGDFDGDGRDDLAIGVPGEDDEDFGTDESGVVQVLYGTSAGLSETGDDIWDQEPLEGGREDGDSFGLALATGDFDDDGYDDLAVGESNEGINGFVRAGAVSVIYGSSGGLTSTGNQMWYQDGGLEGSCGDEDQFGASLVTGDFDGDGYDDLIVGVPGEDSGTVFMSGGINVIYGAASGLTSTGDQYFDQNGSVEDSPQALDGFGNSLASGDFDNDGYDDVAIGVRDEDMTYTDDGAVNVMYGSSSGITVTGDQLWYQGSTNVEGTTASDDQFGDAVAVGDFNSDGYDDLAVGAPGDHPDTTDCGAVNVLKGSSSGVTATSDTYWAQ
jgi:hypothetical protein